MIEKITAYYGPMGARKTGKLLDLMTNRYTKDFAQAFSPSTDNRFGHGIIKERDNIETGEKGREVPSIIIDDVFQIEKHLQALKLVRHLFIDEVNFFESDPIKSGMSEEELKVRRSESMRYLLRLTEEHKKRIYLFGLDLTAEMEPYGLMGTALSFPITKEGFVAECVSCGDPARFTYYIPYEKETNVPGADDYCAMCHGCHIEWSELYKKHKEIGTIREYYRLAKRLKPELEMNEGVMRLAKTLPSWYADN